MFNISVCNENPGREERVGRQQAARTINVKVFIFIVDDTQNGLPLLYIDKNVSFKAFINMDFFNIRLGFN